MAGIPFQFLAMLTIGLAGCSDAGEEPGEDLEASHADPSRLWPIETVRSGLPVCFDKLNALPAKRVAAFKQHVERTWLTAKRINSTEPAIRLAWIGQCPTSGTFNGISIGQLPYGRTQNSAVGIDSALYALERRPSLQVNFELSETEEFYFNRQVVHEFGHALGFIHENQRPDTPQACLDEPSDSRVNVVTGGSAIGPWDVTSVMNHCGGASWLSPGDVSAAQHWYGRQTHGCPVETDFRDNNFPSCECYQPDVTEQPPAKVRIRRGVSKCIDPTPERTLGRFSYPSTLFQLHPNGVESSWQLGVVASGQNLGPRAELEPRRPVVEFLAAQTLINVLPGRFIPTDPTGKTAQATYAKWWTAAHAAGHEHFRITLSFPDGPPSVQIHASCPVMPGPTAPGNAILVASVPASGLRTLEYSAAVDCAALRAWHREL